MLRRVKRVVIKIGSGVLSSAGKDIISSATLGRLVNDICDLEKDGRYEVILVSSGAVMTGLKHLDLKPDNIITIPMKQAAAAVGQVKLMNLYEKYFNKRGKKVAQILLTYDDIESRRRFLNARNAITALLGLGIMPVINENDSAAVHEIKFGDNDTLAAMITTVAEADLLLMLSDVEGLYDADPKTNTDAKLIEEVREITERVMEMAGVSVSVVGAGGMKAKVMAAKIASSYGVPTWIIGGKTPGSIRAALREGKGGTLFHPKTAKMKQRKHWIAHILKPRGKITVDDGARTALLKRGKSLLPSGIVAVSGRFESGDSVSITGETEGEFARGLVNYHVSELKKIKGRKTSEIESILGYKTFDEVIHRNDLVIIR